MFQKRWHWHEWQHCSPRYFRIVATSGGASAIFIYGRPYRRNTSFLVPKPHVPAFGSFRCNVAEVSSFGSKVWPIDAVPRLTLRYGSRWVSACRCVWSAVGWCCTAERSSRTGPAASAPPGRAPGRLQGETTERRHYSSTIKMCSSMVTNL